MVIFTIFILAMILMVMGMAVDMMRFENYRVRLQAAVDQAALSASALAVCDGADDPRAAALDVLRSRGFGDEVISVNVDRVPGSCAVDVHAEISVNTIYMQMLSIDQLSTYVTASAVEQAERVEISLVLDLSNSMGGPKLAELRQATIDFADIVLAASGTDGTSINIIPYGGSVNPGREMFNYLGGVRYHRPLMEERIPLSLFSYRYDPATYYTEPQAYRWPSLSHCMVIPLDEMVTAALPSSGLPQGPFFSAFNVPAEGDFGWCPYDETNEILYASQSLSEITDYVNGLRLNGGTGTDVGMKWGYALTHPSSQPAFAALSAQGVVPSEFRDRPLYYSLPDVAKYIVLMTDGRITPQFEPVATYDPENLVTGMLDRWDDRRTVYDSDRASSNLDSLCTGAKSHGVVVFGVAFLTDPETNAQIQSCASSPSHFYSVNDNNLTTAFHGIAAQISQLRLTN
ncbi:MAG: pilus assembly protein TadG-related protein [Flavimaricola sp.]|nr:pilus assembly protein TadG-related protein [Flavimaricola sp.]